MSGFLQGGIESIITIVIFVVMLAVLVVVHELGHFLTARLAGVRVLEFGLGFPPRARVLRRRGETLYTLNWLPIGGFVRLEGEDGDSDDPRSFVRARLPVKVVILVAGVAMNVVLAFVIFLSISTIANPTWRLSVQVVQDGSPAATAGIVVGDSLVSVDGRQLDGFGSPGSVLEQRAGQAVALGIVHGNGTEATVQATLRSSAQITATNRALGITYQAIPAYAQNPLTTAVPMAAGRTTDALGLIVNGLGQLANSFVAHPTEAPPVTGPVGIANQVGNVFWQLGPVFTLYLAGILSANLALVNILPLPPLDGGRIAILVIQRFTRGRLSTRIEGLAYTIGFACLMTLLIWITFFDITSPGRGQ